MKLLITGGLGNIGRVVVELAGILPPASERAPELTKAINVGGARNLIQAMKEELPSAPLVFISSVSVMGPTQDRQPPTITPRRRPKPRGWSRAPASGSASCVWRR